MEKSFLVACLPFLDQSVCYDLINLDLLVLGPENRTLFNHSNRAFLCPSDGGPTKSVEYKLGSNTSLFTRLGLPNPTYFALTSYSGNFGLYPVVALPIAYPPDLVVPPGVREQANGVFTDERSVKISEITDGTAQTILVSEKYASRVSEMGNAIVINDAPRAFWLAGNLGDTLYLGMFRPNMIFQQPKTVHEALVGASSQHPGGVNVLLADGSARFVSDTISSWDHEQVRLLRFTFVTEQPKGIWQALHTRRDGDSTGDF